MQRSTAPRVGAGIEQREARGERTTCFHPRRHTLRNDARVIAGTRSRHAHLADDARDPHFVDIALEATVAVGTDRARTTRASDAEWLRASTERAWRRRRAAGEIAVD